MACEPLINEVISTARSCSNIRDQVLVSQIKSLTTSEKKKKKNKSPVVHQMKILKDSAHPNQYFMLPDASSSAASSIATSSDSSSFTSIPTRTGSATSVKSTGKALTMVHVKFILLYLDVCKRRVQSNFVDEFSSDTLLQDVVINFQQLCSRQNFRLRGQEFQPRLAYCIGEVSEKNSKPILDSDLGKSLAQLASTNSIIQFSLIADNVKYVGE
ncbi:hypothetical protein GCK72_010734 [Caenorhabditis remanei]|uniref:Uncharacterized protein n=1 Tax=Caenorhabditis remanei TaxID=31234 RepID=A0A6A5H7V0_CAERE|nr:hypothetical protein GCK72_010734 [Caenorhabditis remanei]KAF1762472.1 hypothetical protein GCK72_010734 [Caenorhabditis remanei]